MRNFMEAYAAVHNHEAKEEMTSSRDAISEMNLSPLTDNDLNEIVEEVLEDIFESGFSVNEAYNIFADMFVESNIEGRQQKIDRLCEALNYGFELVESKASTIAIEEFRKHRHGKKLQETWSDRLQQDKRVKKQHSAVVAAESLNVKNLLIQLFNEEIEMEGYKGKHGQSDKEYADSRSSGGKMVSGDSKMSGAEYTHGRRVKAANPGMQSDVGGKTKPKSQGKMDKGTRADITFRKAALKKAALKKEEVEQLDEISKKTMGSYVKKASKDVEGRSYSQGSTDAEWYGPRNLQKDKKIDKRQKGIGRAVDKMTRKEELEEVEQLDEAPYQVMGSPDGKKEKKIGKPVKSRKYADSRAAELSDTHKTTGGQYRSKYVEEADSLAAMAARRSAKMENLEWSQDEIDAIEAKVASWND